MPVFAVAAVPNADPLVLRQVMTPVDVTSVQSPETVNPPRAPPLLYCTWPDVPPGVDVATVQVLPRVHVWPLTVVELLVSEPLPIFVIVFDDPEIVLLVKVSVVARPTSVSVAVGRVKVPVFEIVEIVGVVRFKFVALRPDGSVVDKDGKPTPLVTKTLELDADRNDVAPTPV